ncbi:hypothetical protein [Caballeronia zhejiangensis]|nr:hypothetical protein [Caballeronia zhejiangensis]
MSSLLDAAERITSLVTGRQSQHLEVPSADSAALLSVTAHHISEKMGEPVVLTVTSPSDDSIAVCVMVPQRIIPVIFVPGIMGSNLCNLTESSLSLPVSKTFKIGPASDNGDGTVPVRSGSAPKHFSKACIGFSGIDHEGAYNPTPQPHPPQFFTLWAIVRIVGNVKGTTMEYK